MMMMMIVEQSVGYELAGETEVLAENLPQSLELTATGQGYNISAQTGNRLFHYCCIFLVPREHAYLGSRYLTMAVA
jgi:hypothetical protein